MVSLVFCACAGSASAASNRAVAVGFIHFANMVQLPCEQRDAPPVHDLSRARQDPRRSQRVSFDLQVLPKGKAWATCAEPAAATVATTAPVLGLCTSMRSSPSTSLPALRFLACALADSVGRLTRSFFTSSIPASAHFTAAVPYDRRRAHRGPRQWPPGRR